MAVSLDPLFFYVPVIDDRKKCLSLDSTMEITASVLRSFTDIFYMLHIIFQFRTGFIAPSSRESGRGVLVEDTRAIAKRYLSSYFLIDILSVLPLPQVVILIIIPKMAGSSYLNTKNVLKFAVIFQYVPRFMRIYPLYKEVVTSGIAWAGAAFNLFLYMIASQVIGAFWYLFSIERQTNCWRQACGTQDTCRRAYLFCDGAGGAGNLSFLDNHCPIRTPNETVFNFGIFLDALQSGVVLSSTGFSDKFFYCFWWGMRNLRPDV
ncbi:CYCLIC NUCLEOTIDE-GATED ION CHANNEL 15-RELATED-RELATED [Salix purpurea]|uniref:CYCLIC NUCLEOTIDE-GATED ION CHANNEL 15-RELATED-RELATED n=1 Tax=Salix purpurea TaxID=77065 RepID=A0A9Q0VI47_SALPP|nr:CYCLIC NUCLEOTIDE-GATED ION CHANNEL 15-RELATED-RELATED [Salix purpurea]